MINTYNRYKYHHKILKFLRDLKIKYNNEPSETKHEIIYRKTSIEISEKFKISTNRAVEILTELRVEKLIGWDKHTDEYRILDLGFRFVKLNHFKNTHIQHKYEWITRYVKDGFLIILSLISIYSFVTAKSGYYNLERQLNIERTERKKLQEHLEKELNNVKNLQENQIEIQDSLGS